MICVEDYQITLFIPMSLSSFSSNDSSGEIERKRRVKERRENYIKSKMIKIINKTNMSIKVNGYKMLEPHKTYVCINKKMQLDMDLDEENDNLILEIKMNDESYKVKIPFCDNCICISSSRSKNGTKFPNKLYIQIELKLQTN